MAAARSTRHVSRRLPTAEHAGSRDVTQARYRALKRIAPGLIRA
jgi:hypothetical protein